MNRARVLVLLVIAQFTCVSLWFAANAVMQDLALAFHIKTSIGLLTSMIQFGFIAGTLTYAILRFSDRYSPSKVFFISSVLGAASNLSLLWVRDQPFLLYGLRLLTGFFLAGIYPTGMKIAADYFEKDISKALGYLLGALVLGTAFPHLVKGGFIHLPWTFVIQLTSVLALAGGMLVLLFIPDGPFRKPNPGFKPQVIFSIFKIKPLRQSAFGYFGHMWELYAFWAFIPSAVSFFLKNRVAGNSQNIISEYAFYIIGIGSVACVLGGFVALKIGSRKVAMIALISSGLCCLVSPFMLQGQSMWVLVFLLIWGMMVIMDSPQFSSLIATYAPVGNRGTALTIVNCIGFTITIFSIQLLDCLSSFIEARWLFLFLFPGPLFGVLALLSMRTENS